MIEEAHGPEAIRKLFARLFAEPSLTMVYGLSDIDAVKRHFPEFSYSYPNSTRIRAGVPAKLIYTSEAGPIYQISDAEDNRTSRYLPDIPFTDATIVGDWVVLVALDGDADATAVKSETVKNLFTRLFNDLWVRAEAFADDGGFHAEI